jgi:integrase/recombinase XerD
MKTLADLLAEFLDYKRSMKQSGHTIAATAGNVGAFLRRLEKESFVQTADQLRPRHMETYLKALHVHRTTKGFPLKPRSVNKQIEAVRAFLKYLAMHGLIPRTLVDQLDYVNEPKMLPTSVLHHAQVKKLIGCIRTDTPEGYRDRTMFEALYSTGIRAAEILNLDVPHVDLRNATALVTGKGNKQRAVPIGRTALRHLATYIKAVRPFLVRHPNEAALFLNRRGRRLPYFTFLRLVHVHAERAGLEVHVTPHTFRRSCATEMLRGGANMYHVKEILGHETLQTLQHYAKLTIEDLKKTHERCHPREREED